MGWIERLLRSDQGLFGRPQHVPKDGGMAFRAGLIQDSQERERRRASADDQDIRVNSTWLWTGDRWRKWSTVWKTYDEVDQTTVPTPLLDLLGEHGVTPAAGDRFRFVDGAWRVLDPGESDDLPDPPPGSRPQGV